MRKIATVTLALIAAAAVNPARAAAPEGVDVAAKGSLKTAWTLGETQQPESAYFDPESGFVFVSSVAGNPGEKDGKGWIGKYGADGKAVNARWVAAGLNAPKGMRAQKGTLWVSDIDEVLAIDIESGQVRQRVAVAGAKFLNDVAISADGRVFVSDTMASRIHVIDAGKASVFAEGDELEAPNGLLVDGGRLVVAAWGKITDPATFGTKTPGRLYSLDLATKKKTAITAKPLGNLDGLEMESSGDFLVSDWMAGKLFRVSKDGKSKVLLRGFKNAADIGYMPIKKLVLVPQMGADQKAAYDLTQLGPPRN